MKRIAALLSIFITLFSEAQKLEVATSREFELPNREKFVTLIHADATGVYVLEEHYSAQNYMVKLDKEQTLYKLDNSLNVVFSKKIEPEISSLYFMNDFIYAVTSSYSSKDKKMAVDLKKMSPKDGAVLKTIEKAISIDYLTKSDDSFGRIVAAMQDGSGFSISISQSTDKESKLHVYTFNNDLQPTAKVVIPYGAGNDVAALDATFIEPGKITTVVKNYDYVNEKKKKTFLKNYVMRVYDMEGKPVNELSVAVKDKFITNARFFPGKEGKMIVTGFYSNDMDAEYHNGVFAQVVDLKKMAVLNSDARELSRVSIGYGKEGDKKANQGIGDHYSIKQLIDNPVTNGYIAVNENEHSYNFSHTTFNTDLSKDFYGSKTTMRSENKTEDILLVGLGKTGNIEWIKNVTKSQHETSRSPDPSYTDFPFFSSFSIVPGSKNLHLVFNDHTKNADIVSTSDEAKKTTDFDETKLFVLSLNYETGKLSRKVVDQLKNEDYTLQPKSYKVFNNTLYLPAVKRRTLGKGGFQVSRIAID